MITWRPLCKQLLGVCAIVALIGGCSGQSPVTVNGKLTLPPKTTLKETDSVQVSFAPVGKETGGSATDADPKSLTFKLENSLKPGKYKVAVTIQPYGGEPGNEGRMRQFEMGINAKFGVENTPLSIEIGSEPEQSIVIDLEKGNVTK